MHKLVKTLGKAHGDHYEEEKEYEKFLYQEFPTNPIAEIAKLAGLPKPVVEAELES
jgi:tRNA 2-thiouridine synthesizing protein E